MTKDDGATTTRQRRDNVDTTSRRGRGNYNDETTAKKRGSDNDEATMARSWLGTSIILEITRSRLVLENITKPEKQPELKLTLAKNNE